MTTTITAAGQDEEAMAQLGMDHRFNSDKIIKAVQNEDIDFIGGLFHIYTEKAERLLDLLSGITSDLELQRHIRETREASEAEEEGEAS